VFVEDSSRNGTFINSNLFKVANGDRVEIKSGDEIYLVKPGRDKSAAKADAPGAPTAFMFVNERDRKRHQMGAFLAAATAAAAEESGGTTAHKHHIEVDYNIFEELGKGACGTVYRCQHIATGAVYAVKAIDTSKFAMTPGLSVNELREEAEMMQRLDHPGIVKIKATYETDHWFFIVMEHIRGGDLFDRILERERYSEENARSVMKQILDAVSYLHAADICHRDLKPENILLVNTAATSQFSIFISIS